MPISPMAPIPVSPIIMTVLWGNVFGPFDERAPDLRAVCRSHVDLLLHGLLKDPEAA